MGYIPPCIKLAHGLGVFGARRMLASTGTSFQEVLTIPRPFSIVALERRCSISARQLAGQKRSEQLGRPV